MQPWIPSLASAGIGVLTFVAAIISIWMGRKSKREESVQTSAAHALEERNSAYDQVSALADRYRSEAEFQREQRAKDRTEWDGIWDRQINRCRSMTDAASHTITTLMRYVPPKQQYDANHVLDQLVEHRNADGPRPSPDVPREGP